MSEIIWVGVGVGIVSFFTGALLAAGIVWFVYSRKLKTERQSLAQAQERAVRAETTLESERQSHAARLQELEANEQRMKDAFAHLSSEILQKSSEQFLQLAQERIERQQEHVKHDLSALVEPLRSSLDRQAEQVQQLEQLRQHAFGTIEEQLRRMTEDQQRLQSETANLVKALRQPQVRGRWGEFQLEQVVKLAGMSEHCDFSTQVSMRNEEGALQRPDMLIRLPNQRTVVIDSKVPLEAYLAAIEAQNDEERKAQMEQHAKQIRKHIDEMGKRNYQAQINGAYDFVVLFIPGEVFLNAALEHDKGLLEHAFNKGVILATPSSLIGLLKAVALGWREARLSEDAHKIKLEGEKLYKALSSLVEHIATLGKNLNTSVLTYNKLIGSIETRFLPSARKMRELQISDKELTEPELIEATIRPFTKQELVESLAAQPDQEPNALETNDASLADGEAMPALTS